MIEIFSSFGGVVVGWQRQVGEVGLEQGKFNNKENA